MIHFDKEVFQLPLSSLLLRLVPALRVGAQRGIRMPWLAHALYFSGKAEHPSGKKWLCVRSDPGFNPTSSIPIHVTLGSSSNFYEYGFSLLKVSQSLIYLTSSFQGSTMCQAQCVWQDCDATGCWGQSKGLLQGSYSSRSWGGPWHNPD